MNNKAFKIGEMLDIYLNPQTKEGFLGKGKLLEYVSTGLPFILTPSKISEELNLHYVIEYWKVNLNGEEYVKGIRRVWGIGKLPSFVNTKEQNDSDTAAIQENFVLIPEYDTSFWNDRVESELPLGSMY